MYIVQHMHTPVHNWVIDFQLIFKQIQEYTLLQLHLHEQCSSNIDL